MSEIRVNRVVNAEGSDATSFPYGFSLPAGIGITGSGSVNVGGPSTIASSGGITTTGGDLFAGDSIGVLKDIKIGAAATIGGALSGTTGTFSGALSGSTGTFSGAVNVDDTTDSTSSSTGALIIDGGLGIAKNVFIGAGLSVAGTLTYEDATNIDSVGLITAQSGIRVPGGEVKVGTAFTIGNVGVATFIGAAGVAVTITPSTGKVQATTFEGPLTGDVTGNADTATSATNSTNSSHVLVTDNESTNEDNLITFVEGATSSTGNVGLEMDGNLYYNPSTGKLTATQLAGTLQTAAQTNVTSLGSLSALTITGDLTFDNGTNAGKDLIWDASDNALEFSDSVNATFGDSSDFIIFHDGSHAYLRNTTGTLYIQAKNGENAITATPDGGTLLAYDNSTKIATTNDGVSITGMSTVTTGAHFQGMLREDCNIVANKLSAGTNIDLANGMVHYYSTNETTTATPNIRWNSSYSLNNKMSTGETVSVTIIYKPNGAGYYAALNVDGSGVTEEWNGGSAPSAANSDGYDVLTHTLVKTGSGTFLCLSNVSNFT